ncbi:hypothetical protein KQI86_03310 [Clostridium sp. MSJ-11]|uniref:DNA-binding protein n=1 Tax=Clostridium mobile TaxID=2841512 RepID=A0ABS6EF49_9CLOT|nr:hypothetical protein [Clostridium mobile]MBU5483341.1 hypothetical protein [Clostridium mobile]
MTEENKNLEKELEETEETTVVDENKENAIETEDKIEIEDKVEEVSAELETTESTENTEVKNENSIFMDNLKNVGIMLSISLAAYLILDMVILRILGYKFAKTYIGTGILFVYLLVTIVYPVFKKDKKH